jgi:hypothetical protein
MRFPHRKSRVQRALHTVGNALDASGAPKLALPGAIGSKGLKGSLPKDTAVKAGLVAGGLAGLTAGSAGISALRRRTEGETDDS